MKKIIILFIIITAACFQAKAQNSYSIQYAIAFPTGDLNEFIGKTSFRGVFFEYQYELTPQLAVGLAGGIQTFYERQSYATYTEGTVSLSGLQYRYTNSFPILLTLDYYHDREAVVTPFAGVGIGTIYSDRDVDMGLYRSEIDAWQFGLQPEVGILYNINDQVGFKVGGKYFQGFSTSELDGQSYFSLNIGLVFGGGY